MAELQLPKLTTRVRFPSSAPRTTAFIAQSVERIHGKDEVTSSILVKGSTMKEAPLVGAFFIVDFIRSHAGNFPPYHGGAPDARAAGMAGAEASMLRSRPKRDAERAFAREHRCAGLATKTGEDYPPAKSRHGKDEVKFDSG